MGFLFWLTWLSLICSVITKINLRWIFANYPLNNIGRFQASMVQKVRLIVKTDKFIFILYKKLIAKYYKVCNFFNVLLRLKIQNWSLNLSHYFTLMPFDKNLIFFPTNQLYISLLSEKKSFKHIFIWLGSVLKNYIALWRQVLLLS